MSNFRVSCIYIYIYKCVCLCTYIYICMSGKVFSAAVDVGLLPVILSHGKEEGGKEEDIL